MKGQGNRRKTSAGSMASPRTVTATMEVIAGLALTSAVVIVSTVTSGDVLFFEEGFVVCPPTDVAMTSCSCRAGKRFYLRLSVDLSPGHLSTSHLPAKGLVIKLPPAIFFIKFDNLIEMDCHRCMQSRFVTVLNYHLGKDIPCCDPVNDGNWA